jgi:hypothetical protein
MPRKSGRGVIGAELAVRRRESERDSRTSAGDRATMPQATAEELEGRRRALRDMETPPSRRWPHVERLP